MDLGGTEYEGVDLIRLAQEKVQHRPLMNKVMDHWVSS